MRNIVFAFIVTLLLALPSAAEDAHPPKKRLVTGTTRTGLEITVLELSPAERDLQSGRTLARFGSCPPGLQPKGMESSRGFPVPISAMTLQFRLKVLPAYAGKQAPSPPLLVDESGERHEPISLWLMPQAEQLNQLKTAPAGLLCELTYEVNFDIKAIEFEGARWPWPASASK